MRITRRSLTRETKLSTFLLRFDLSSIFLIREVKLLILLKKSSKIKLYRLDASFYSVASIINKGVRAIKSLRKNT
jgi:hypothetical protein